MCSNILQITEVRLSYWSIVKSSLSELQRPDGSLTNCDSEMANILNDCFATVFVTEDTTNMPSLGDVCSGNCLTEITISIDDVGINFNLAIDIFPKTLRIY